jgi:hypothetical protein
MPKDMSMNLPVLFTIRIFHGRAEVNRIMSYENHVFKFVLMHCDAFVRLMRYAFQELLVPIEQVQEISLREGEWCRVVTLRVSTKMPIAEIPDTFGGVIAYEMHMKRYREAASIVSSLNISAR